MDPQNPYLEAPSDQLALACSRAAEDLGANRPRSREERLELAQRVRQLLLAAARRIAPTGSWFARPEAGRREGDFFDSLREDHAQRLREMRYRALVMAAEHALGSAARAWLRDARRGEDRIYDLALASEEGLEVALAELAARSRRS